MFEGHDQAIFDLLAERRLVEPVPLQAAWTQHRTTGRPLARVLLELGLLDKPALLRAVASHVGGEYADDLPAEISRETAELVGSKLVRTYGVAPITVDGLSVTLAAVDPFSPNLVDELTFALDCDVRLRMADPERVRLLIQRHYGATESAPGVTADDASSPVDGVVEIPSEADIAQLAGQPPVIRFVNGVLAQAIRDKASDIHFEPFEREFKIRCRVDGTLHEMVPPPRRLALPVLSRLKVLANLNIAERRLPQDGRIKLTLEGRAVDLRVSTLPTQFGESVVLRVLDQSSVGLELGQLGLPDFVRSGIGEVIRRPNGIFLVTGPTGSGKTTTLYSCLRQLNTDGAKLLTVEDPVEYEIDGIMQVPVNLPAGLTFARALRTFLRQDPDIVMVGEIRDLETARISIQAALTGHLVLSTLHTNDAPSAVTRLVDMGIEPFLLASTIEAVLAQRLVRRLCVACRQGYQPGEALRQQIGDKSAGRPFFRAVGCPACQGTGYAGRLGIFEFLPMTDSLRELVARGVSLIALRQRAMEQGMVPLRENGLAAILAGDTTVEEVLKYT